MEYEFMHYRARDLQLQAARRRLVLEAQAARRERSGNRPGLLRRLAGSVRAAAPEAAPQRLREC
ncbi:hypothetical protein [Streptomyces sp. NPDC001380]|uniref:hypothetical protein n=1 Tax=Streptomyces sp. NPDC001380 TaxID=3364566 RepID=UPI0036A5AC8D